MMSLPSAQCLRYPASHCWPGYTAAVPPKISASARRDIGLAIFAGILCYYLGALANFYALTIIDASVERPLLFAYPIFVVLIKMAIERKAPSPRVILALILTSLGVLLVTGALNTTLTDS